MEIYMSITPEEEQMHITDTVSEDEISVYARYEDIDQEQLEKDIDAIKEMMPAVGEEDFQHLLKLERWGKMFTYSGIALKIGRAHV